MFIRSCPNRGKKERFRQKSLLQNCLHKSECMCKIVSMYCKIVSQAFYDTDLQKHVCFGVSRWSLLPNALFGLNVGHKESVQGYVFSAVFPCHGSACVFQAVTGRNMHFCCGRFLVCRKHFAIFGGEGKVGAVSSVHPHVVNDVFLGQDAEVDAFLSAPGAAEGQVD